MLPRSFSAMITKSHRSWLLLRLVPEMTRVRFYTLIDHFQSPELALGAQAKEVASLRGFDAALARKVLDAPRTVAIDKELELMQRENVRLLTIEDEDYPENLRQSSFPPPIIYLKGKLIASDKYSVAIVGSRHATQYGKAVAQQFATLLAAAGLTTISGFARGVDSIAHDSAIRAAGRTLGILGNGHSVCYPAENRKLGERIAEQGALITEYPMETPPDRYNFPERNHIIAAISLGTIVVEAAEKSGALITANEALDENRFVFAVPGDINRNNSRGTNKLIQSGAKLVQSVDDVLAEMRHLLRGFLREEDAPAQANAATPGSTAGATNGNGATRLPKTLSEEEAHIYSFLRHEPHYLDALLARLDPERYPLQRLTSLLLALELKQVVRQLPGKLYTAVELTG